MYVCLLFEVTLRMIGAYGKTIYKNSRNKINWGLDHD